MAVNESSTIDLEDTQSTTVCMNCNELNDHDNYCLTCNGDFCQTCITSLHKDHSILSNKHSLVQNLKMFLADTCTLHKNEILSMYCNTCKLPCCLSCLDGVHDGHSMSTIKSVAKQADFLYSKVVDVLPEVESMHREMETEYDTYVKSVFVTSAGIKDQFLKLRKCIDEMEASMLQPLEKELDEVRKIHTDKKKLLNDTKYLVELFEVANKTENHLLKAAFLSICPAIGNICSEKESIPESVTFTPASVDVSYTEEKIGLIKRSSGEPLITTKSHDGIIDIPTPDLISLQSRCLAINGRVLPLSDGRRWIISGPTYNQNTSCWTSKLSFMDYSLVLRDNWTLVKYYDRLEFDVSIIPPSDLVYTDSENGIWRLTKSGAKSFLLDTSPVSASGICYTSDGLLVLGLHESGKTRPSFIRIYSLDDLKSLSEIEKDEHDKPIFSYIKSIIENNMGYLIVHDNNDLLCICRQGNVKWKLNFGNSFKYFCCDKFRNTIVAIDNEIRIFDFNGKYIKTLLKKADFLTEPTSLSIDKDGLLWIGQNKNTKVLKYWK